MVVPVSATPVRPKAADVSTVHSAAMGPAATAATHCGRTQRRTTYGNRRYS
jgi:hypothetical protein